MEHWNICTCSTQREVEDRLPPFMNASAENRQLDLLPLCEDVDIKRFLGGPDGIQIVRCGGDDRPEERLCRYEWVRHVRIQCIRAGIPFEFLTTGIRFSRQGKEYRIESAGVQRSQAEKSCLSDVPGTGAAEGIRYTTPTEQELVQRLGRSAFRSRFHLDAKDQKYLEEKGFRPIEHHAADFVRMRLAAENPEKDGAQTPMRGHPVFKAQHATGCWCRECLEKWHNIPAGKPLSEEEQRYIVEVLMGWIRREAGIS